GDRLQLVFTFPTALPSHSMFSAHSGAACSQRNLVSDDEGGIEPYAELADEVGIFHLISGQALEKLTRTRLRDGADICDDLLARHADAVVGDRYGSGGGVEIHVDRELAVVLEQGAVGHGLEAQLVARIRCVGYQLAQEDLLVAIQGVNHQIQELLDLGLEAE